MTREIRYRDKDGGHLKTPKYIDHGHWGRKTVFYTLAVILFPLMLTQLVAVGINAVCEWVGVRMNRLRVWSHPCLYGKGPKREREND